MLSVTENKSTFSDQDLVQMVRRENNPKRNFLLVNSKQGKHIPADPHDVMIIFSQLAGCIKDVVSDEKVLFIGFAETATAVGTGVASCFENACYVHTTREKYISEKYLVAEFSEEHSHAVEQLLFFKNWEETAAELDRIVFVEDEISTGKTIENFVKVLKKDRFLSPDIKFSACSILNGMSDERKNELLSENLDFYYLAKISAAPDSDEVYSFDSTPEKKRSKFDSEEITIRGKSELRTGMNVSEYLSACAVLSEKIRSRISFENLDIAVIGTEECMYPAIYTAADILEKDSALSVVTHSTTRSPIVADSSEDYPLKSRYQVESFYDKSRKTYIYNSDIKKYDIVLIITDSENDGTDVRSIADAFRLSDKFITVRWVK